MLYFILYILYIIYYILYHINYISIYIYMYILHCDDSPSVLYCITSLRQKSHHPSLSMDHKKVSGCQTSSLHNSVANHFNKEEYFQLVCVSIFFHNSIATFVECGIRGCTLWESDPSGHCSNQNRVRRSCLGNSCLRPQAPCAMCLGECLIKNQLTLTNLWGPCNLGLLLPLWIFVKFKASPIPVCRSPMKWDAHQLHLQSQGAHTHLRWNDVFVCAGDCRNT